MSSQLVCALRRAIASWFVAPQRATGSGQRQSSGACVTDYIWIDKVSIEY